MKIGFVLTTAGEIVIETTAKLLGTDKNMLQDCIINTVY